MHYDMEISQNSLFTSREKFNKIASTIPMQPSNFEAQKNLGREDAYLR